MLNQFDFEKVNIFKLEIENESNILKFFSLFVKKNKKNKSFFFNKINFFNEYHSKFNQSIKLYKEFQSKMTILYENKLDVELQLIKSFKGFIFYLTNLFKFVFYLFSNNYSLFDEANKNTYFRPCILLFKLINKSKEEHEINKMTKFHDVGGLLYKNKSSIGFIEDYNSVIFSLDKIFFPHEDN